MKKIPTPLYPLHLLISLTFAYTIRNLQVSTLNAIGYSPYASQQVFQLLNWKHNDDIIQTINSQSNLTFKAQHNQFSGMSYSQIQATILTLTVTSTPSVVANTINTQIQQSQVGFPPTQFLYASGANYYNVINVDWRLNGSVSEVKNQGKCGACWAFSATSQLESKFLMQSNIKLSLSEQQLIDCSSNYGNIGCAGGMMDSAFRYVINNGITTNSFYPYQATTNSCSFQKATMQSYSIKNSKIIYNDCSALTSLLQKQPVTVVVSVNIFFIFYSEGILNSCGTVINHAIQLVGYYKDSQKAYYVGKNSWGPEWGQKGFVNIDANVQNGNLCNVCAYPQYVE